MVDDGCWLIAYDRNIQVRICTVRIAIAYSITGHE
jgi:hypothetical protein